MTRRPGNNPQLQRLRLEQIHDGLKEGVRREVERLRKLGLPIYVGTNGSVVALPPDSPTRPAQP